MAVVAAVAILFINKLLVLILKGPIIGSKIPPYNINYTGSISPGKPNRNTKTHHFGDRFRKLGKPTVFN